MTTSHPRIGLSLLARGLAAAAQLSCWPAAVLALMLLLCCTPAFAAPTSVHGHVISHFTGQPFADSYVEIVDARFYFLDTAPTDADGAYQWSGDCPDSGGAVCIALFRRTYDTVRHDAAIASFANGAQDAVVDLQPHAMAHLSGSVHGLDAARSYVGPILTFRYDTASSSWQTAPDDVYENGFPTIGAYLPEGRYRVCVGGMQIGLQRQCFDHKPEAGSWAQQTYTDIDLAEGEARDGVDFDLVPGGSIEGTLLDAAKGAPLVGLPYNGHWQGLRQSVVVELYDADGMRFDSGYAYTDQQGKYRVSGTPAGSFRVQLGTWREDFRDALQVYPGIACAALPCPIDAGTPVAVHDRYVVYGIDMPLHPSVTIRGTVTDALTHQPIAGATVASWRRLPSFFEEPPQFEVYWTQSDAQGKYVAYAAADSPWGTYVVAGSSTLVSSLYPNAACPNGVESLCLDPYPWLLPDYGLALAIHAQTGDAISGIDFALQRGGTFSGLMHDITGAPLFGVITIHDASGAQVAAFLGHGFDAFGHLATYQSPALPPGTYYATATAFGGPCQTYSARACPTQAQSILDVAPTPITIAPSENRSGVDFRIAVDGVFIDGFGG